MQHNFNAFVVHSELRTHDLLFVTGLLSWDVNNCLIDLEKELAIITEQAPEGEEARYGKCRMYIACKQY